MTNDGLFGLPVGHPRSVTRIYKAAGGKMYNGSIPTSVVNTAYPLDVPREFSMARLLLIGGGGGGGSGYVATPPATQASGGGGGAGGYVCTIDVPAESLGGLYAMVGHGGKGGTYSAAGNGEHAGMGGHSFIGPRPTTALTLSATTHYIVARGGRWGSGATVGTAVAGTNASDEFGSFGAYKGSAGGVGNDGTPGTGNDVPDVAGVREDWLGASGGGGGGGVDGAGTTYAGGIGGANFLLANGGLTTGVLSGIGEDSTSHYYIGPGPGGSGGLGLANATSGYGARGSLYGGGGGGGGGCDTTKIWANGGDGADGIIVITYY